MVSAIVVVAPGNEEMEAAAQIANGSSVTSHPSVKDKLTHYNYREERVVVSGHLITSRGPGTTFEFALEIIKQLDSSQKADQVAGPMLVLKS
ncbi:hypothetical protein HK103_006774 [Boothiomyces macroporosus]|uniref:D-lactate dehydratase n=1 Tax=Boothiomyces macroporosus TaxID=261099 RepID=A0AAD5Y1V3_9FUNG|nr:hypothetical protein HK103_006774 [Boothiomyces macroporosus]